jgi:hypothetical protein
MKRHVSRVLALVWLLGAIYYVSSLSYATLVDGARPSRQSVTLLVASLWVGSAAILLIRGRVQGWWALMIFMWVAAGGHLSRLFSRPETPVTLASAEPFIWVGVFLAMLTWLRSNVGGRSAFTERGAVQPQTMA